MQVPNIESRMAWQEWAAKYEDEFTSVHRKNNIKELEKIVYYIIEKLDIKKDDVILDAGCGSGVFSFLINKIVGAKIIGVDFSFKHLEIMKKKFPFLKSVRGDVGILPFKKEVFDKVLCYSVLHYVDLWSDTIKELIRVTKREGKIFIGDLPDRNKKWKYYLYSMVKAVSSLRHPLSLRSKMKYIREGPSWFWFDISKVIAFMEELGFRGIPLKQPISLQYGTETYRFRVDILIDLK